MTNIRVSQEVIEVLLLKYPNLRVSQEVIEVLLLKYPNLRVSQLAIEVLISDYIEPPSEGRVLGPPTQVI